MAGGRRVAIIKRFSTKKIKTKSKGNKQGGWKKKKKKSLVPDQDIIVYTYILKDLDKDIFKIGKTTDPHGRFRNLCKRDKIVPIGLVYKDIEIALHHKYKKNRTVHPDYKDNGGTEWFKRGGTFDEFIEKVEGQNITIPFMTLHNMVLELMETSHILVSDSNTQWELTQSEFAYYHIGLEILRMLGKVKPTSNGYDTEDKNNIFIIGKKISISEDFLKHLKDTFIMYISDRAATGLINDKRDKDKYGSRLRKIDIGTANFDSEVYLMLNKVL